MNRPLSLLLLAACIAVPGSPAVAVQAACDIIDTPSFSNTGYTGGPGSHYTGGASDGSLHAETYVDSGDPSEWSMSTDRINGARHVIPPGTWTVTWEWGDGYAAAATDGAANLVTRFGGQIEVFAGNPDVFFGGWSQDVEAPPDGTYYLAFPAAQGESGAFEVNQSIEMGALFFVDAHAQRTASSYAATGVVWSGLSICWRRVDSSAAFEALQPVVDAASEVTPIIHPLGCPVLASLRGGVPGVIDIDNQGDVAVAGEPVWNCPPYGS